MHQLPKYQSSWKRNMSSNRWLNPMGVCLFLPLPFPYLPQASKVPTKRSYSTGDPSLNYQIQGLSQHLPRRKIWSRCIKQSPNVDSNARRPARTIATLLNLLQQNGRGAILTALFICVRHPSNRENELRSSGGQGECT